MQKLQDASCLTHYISVTLVFHFIFNSCHNDSGGLAHRDTWKFPGGPSNQRPPKMYVPSSVFVSWFSGVIDQICTSITEWFSVNQDLIAASTLHVMDWTLADSKSCWTVE